MFSPDMIKPAIFLAILTAVIGAATMGFSAVKQSGRDEVFAELSEKFKDDLDKANKEHREQLAIATHEREFFRKQSIMLQNQDPVIITKWKEKVIHENPNCTKLNGFSIMLNESIKRFNI